MGMSTLLLKRICLETLNVNTNVVWERAEWDVGIDSSDGLFTNEVN